MENNLPETEVVANEELNDKIEEIYQEAMASEQETMNNRHTAEDPFSNVKNVDDMTEEEQKKVKEVIMLPTADSKAINSYGEDLDRFGTANIRDNFTERQKQRARMVLEGERYTVKDGVYLDNLKENESNMVNNIQYGDKDLNLRYPPSGVRGETTGNVAIAKINSILNIGEITQVPLWHSGFWVTFKSPTQKALINLDLAIANSQITLGRDTNTLIFSNYQVVFNRIIIEFLLDHITAYTIKLPEDKQLEDFILIQDYYPLILGLLSSMYPNGIFNTRGCANVAKVNDEGSPACDYVINSTLDPKKLLWVNRKALTKPMLEHMSNRRTTSVSAESVIEYQKSVAQLLDRELDLETENGVPVKILFSSPTLAEYTDRGEYWVNEIIQETESLFSEGDTADKKNEKILDMMSTKLLGVYNTYVKEIKVQDLVVKDQQTIEETLATIGIEEKILESFFKSVAKYITESAIAMVAIPSYICPKCGVDHSEGRAGVFKSFIPLNLVEHFFVLSAFRINRTRQMM